jgi:regulator of replication initiation timing
MVQINPDQLFTMMGKLQAELMVLREENVALGIRNRQLEAQLAQPEAKKKAK